MTEQDEPDTHDAPAFADLGLSGPVMQALVDVGYETPSPIQAQAIPPLLEGKHVVGLAQTGTGKTAAFALPILSRIDLDVPRGSGPQVLVLAPTRELALQVAEAFGKYAAHLEGLSVLPVYGGQGYGVQLSALRRGVHVVVGTPGRVMDHLEKGTLDLSGLRHVVLDEADEMLNMGFAEDVETILSDTPADKQVALFSATMPSAIRRISQQHAPGAEQVTVKGGSRTAANVTQRYLYVSWPQKIDALTRILEVESFDAAIVFVRTKQATEEVAEKLRARGFSAAAINGDIVQQQRERTVEALRSGSLDVLVATDVAARGLDVERVSHVINFDIPTDTEAYVHRIGRTGRAGRAGDAISFVTPREKHLLRSIERATKQTIAEMPKPSVADVNATRVLKFTEAITAALEDSQLPVLRDLIGAYAAENGKDPLDVAAAVAVLAQDGDPLFIEDEPESAPVRERKGDRDSGGGPRRTTWRIAVGKRHKVEPRQIVGALANEGGLRRGDFGKIDIRPGFSLVELPELSAETLRKLSTTRISGVLIDIRPDRGRPAGAKGGRSPGQDRPDQKRPDHRPDHKRPDKKPRHKKAHD